MGMVVALVFSLAGGVCARGGPAQDTTQASQLAEGRIVHKPTKQFYYYRVSADSTIFIRQERSASGDSALAIPATILRPIYHRAKEQILASGPIESVAVGYEDNNLVLQFTQRFNLYVLLALVFVVVVGGAVLFWLWRRLVRERRRREAQARSRRYLTQGREKERKRLSKEIHDGPVQDLHGLHMQMKALASDRGEHVADELMRVTAELRAMSADLHPPALDKFGLAAALNSHADRLSDRHEALKVELDLDEGDAPLPDDHALALFRVAQEAMNNAVQHGEAGHLRVRLQRGDGTVTLEVRDDGAGFSPPDDWHALADEDHYGLLGMRERAEAVGADIAIDSAPGDGTRVRVRGTVGAALAENGRPDPVPAGAA
jgi:signal transduction histidine kinase